MLRSALLFCLAVLALPIAAAEEDLLIREAVLEDRRGESWIIVRGQGRLPDRARLTSTLAYQGREARGFHASGYVEAGSFAIEMGPLEQRLLPGGYTVLVSFSLGEQHPAIRKMLQSSAEITPTRLLAKHSFSVGTPEEEKQIRDEQIRAYQGILQQLSQAMRQFLDGHAEFEKGTKYVDSSRKIDAETWGPWVDGMLKLVEGLDKQRVNLETTVLTPMFPETHEKTQTGLDVMRQVVLAVTRTSYQKAGIAIPERYDQPERFQGIFSNPHLLEVKLADIRAAEKLLEHGTEDKPIAVGGTGKSRAEELVEIQQHFQGVLKSIETSRTDLAAKLVSMGGALSAPEEFEGWYKGWVDQLGRKRPERGVIGLTTEMTTETMIGLKYPYLYDLVEELIHDLSETGALEAIRLYVAAKLTVPEHHLKKQAAGGGLTLEQVAGDLKTQQSVYQVRLKHVCGLLKIDLAGGAPKDGK